MNSLHSKLLLPCLIALSTISFAEDTTQAGTAVEFNTRPLPAEIRMLEEQKKALEANKDSEEQVEHACAACPRPRALPVSSIFFPMDHHWIAEFPAYNIIKFEDGSEWNVQSGQAHKIQGWRTGDDLIVAPNRIWFSPSPYCIANQTTNDFVEVTPILGPLAFGAYTHWVIGFDFNYGYVYLTNGKGERTAWHIDGADTYKFNTWQINDTIIIGVKDHWTDAWASHDHILINVPANHYVNAKEY